MPAVFTIHNLAYQGVFERDWLPRLGLGWELMAIDGLEFWGRISFLKGGMREPAITTVSPRYAEEIQTPEYGFGFDGILRAARSAIWSAFSTESTTISGIRRAIRILPEPYDAERSRREGAPRSARCSRCSELPPIDATMARPLVGMVSRLVDQKGLRPDRRDRRRAAAARCASFVLLGTGERRYEDMWLGLAARHPDRDRRARSASTSGWRT